MHGGTGVVPFHGGVWRVDHSYEPQGRHGGAFESDPCWPILCSQPRTWLLPEPETKGHRMSNNLSLTLSLRTWSLVVLLLGLAALIGGMTAASGGGQGGVPSPTSLLLCSGAIALIIALLVGFSGGHLQRLVDKAAAAAVSGRQPSYETLFIASFVALFAELMLIRYCGSQIRIFSFYKNVPLIGSFLGLGLGACLGGGRTRHVLKFLLWLAPLSFLLAIAPVLLGGSLGGVASAATSEHILGDYWLTLGPGGRVAAQVLMALFCLVAFAVITLLFVPLGRLLGDAFGSLPRLPAYTVNISGSLAGILVFVGLSYLQTPPWIWYVVALSPLFWWLRGSREILVAGGLATMSIVTVLPTMGDTVWSPYQKLVGHSIPAGPGGDGSSATAYLVEISDVFYQVALDLRPAAVARYGNNPYPHYDAMFRNVAPLDRVLVVGSGTGNDVAAALRAGAMHVDAVDIDPAILRMGQVHHPERPYNDPRVRLIVADARAAFHQLEPDSYDAVVFGLLDSHTQLGHSSVRLDNYVFTAESFDAARRLLRPGGHFLLAAATFQPWFADRLHALLTGACESPVSRQQYRSWSVYRCTVATEEEGGELAMSTGALVPTDDWPFLYLRDRSVPLGYAVVVLFLIAGSVWILKRGGLPVNRFDSYHTHLFFLGAAFLLLEVYAINRLALLFGTTWLVSAVTIAMVMILILAANVTVIGIPSIDYRLTYGLLFVSLIGSFLVEPTAVLGGGVTLSFLVAAVVLAPVFFAGTIFARSFESTRAAGFAIGANMLGAVLGGWVEYATMATGIRSMVVLALGLYLASAVSLALHRSRERATNRVSKLAANADPALFS